jgi:hypothetical protein
MASDSPLAQIFLAIILSPTVPKIWANSTYSITPAGKWTASGTKLPSLQSHHSGRPKVYGGWQKHALHIIQLYEQLRQNKATSIEMASTLGLYVNHWQRWAVAGLQIFEIDIYGDLIGTIKNHQYQPISIPVNRQVIVQRHRKNFYPPAAGKNS